ncbi:MAG: hypothetical protein MK102_15640 [Fuerstiella sp.]|nr:hypothetical protein [Fuerstiella sp.]
MKISFPALASLALLLTTGCSEDTPEPTITVTEPAPAEVVPDDDTAEAAVRAIINGLSTGKTDVIWEALPPGYQRDVNTVVRTFGNGMDPTQWQQIHGAVGQIHSVLSTKADFIVNVPLIQKSEQAEQLSSAIPHIAGFLKTILDHTDLESLKLFEGGEFFSGPGSHLIGQLDELSKLWPEGVSLSSMKDVKIETISSTDDKATLKITNPVTRMTSNTTESEDVVFVKVDDRWIPMDLADNWDKSVASAKNALSQLPASAEENAVMVSVMTSMITGVLQPLDAAEDQEQFNTAVEQMLAGIGGMLGPMFGGMQMEMSPETDSGFESSSFEHESPFGEEPSKNDNDPDPGLEE